MFARYSRFFWERRGGGTKVSRTAEACALALSLLFIGACDDSKGNEDAAPKKRSERSEDDAEKDKSSRPSKPKAADTAAEPADTGGPMIVPVGTAVPEEVARISSNDEMQREPPPLLASDIGEKDFEKEDPAGTIDTIMPVIGAVDGARSLRPGETAYAWGNGKWYRVSVVGSAGSNYSCSFVGYDLTAPVHPSRLRTAQGQIVLAPGQAASPAPPPRPQPAPQPQAKPWCSGPYGRPDNVHQWQCKHEDFECCKTNSCQLASCYRKCVQDSVVSNCRYIGCCLESAGPNPDF